jgi:hypothetical protein
MIANIIWNAMKTCAGMVGANDAGSPPTPRRSEVSQVAEYPARAAEREAVAPEHPLHADERHEDEALHQ